MLPIVIDSVHEFCQGSVKFLNPIDSLFALSISDSPLGDAAAQRIQTSSDRRP